MSEPTGPSNRFDPSTAFYAWVGASDLALEAARKAAAEVQTQLEGARLQLRDLQKDPKGAVDQARSRVQSQLDTAARQLEQRAAELRTNLGGLVDWDGLAARGHRVVGKGGATAAGPTSGPAPTPDPGPPAGTGPDTFPTGPSGSSSSGPGTTGPGTTGPGTTGPATTGPATTGPGPQGDLGGPEEPLV